MDRDRLVRVAALILPREFRDRVLEPALADLLADEARSGRRGVGARLVLVAECLRLGIPQLLWHRGRPTRLATIMVAVLVGASLVLMRRDYGVSGLGRSGH